MDNLKVCFLAPNSAPYWDDTIAKFNMLFTNVQIDLLICNDKLSRHPEWKYVNENASVKYLQGIIQVPILGYYNIGFTSKIKEYDVVIIGGYYPLTCLAALLYCILKKKKFIFASDCVDYGHHYMQFKKRMFQLLRKKALGFWVPGRASVDFYRNIGVEKEKIICGFYAYDMNKVLEIYQDAIKRRRELRKNYHIEEGDYVFLFIGKLTKRRNIKGIVDAFEILQRKVENVKLLIVGDGEDRDIVEASKEKLKNNLIYLKAVELSKSHELFAICDAYIHAGDEQYSLTVYEAYLLGMTCVVNRRVGCVYDMKVKSNLFLFDFEDKNRLAKLLQEVVKVKREEHQRVDEVWDFNVITKDLYNLLWRSILVGEYV